MMIKEPAGQETESVKLVAILFADIVVTSTIAADHLNFARAIVEVFERAAQLLRAHHGELVKSTGDGFFGIVPNIRSHFKTYRLEYDNAMSC